ncbi:MAG: hypothetical protein KGI37_08355 [Alphaproteobacteria bacterium]|nr:hypothetical protein [Alphaproteobacteria bacterium]
MLRSFVPAIGLCLVLTACAGTSPEDAHMADALCTQGKVLLAEGRARDARDIYASATNRDADNARAWNGLGVANDMLGKRAEAADAYQHAADLAPHDLGIVNNMAHLDMEKGDAADAVALLQPYADDKTAPAALRANLDAARKMAAAGAGYADLGSYPTEAMAQAHAAQAKGLAGDDGAAWHFDVAPEVKVTGGIPTFTVRVTGANPQDICAAMMAQAMPCVAMKGPAQ